MVDSEGAAGAAAAAVVSLALRGCSTRAMPKSVTWERWDGGRRATTGVCRPHTTPQPTRCMVPSFRSPAPHLDDIALFPMHPSGSCGAGCALQPREFIRCELPPPPVQCHRHGLQQDVLGLEVPAARNVQNIRAQIDVLVRAWRKIKVNLVCGDAQHDSPHLCTMPLSCRYATALHSWRKAPRALFSSNDPMLMILSNSSPSLTSSWGTRKKSVHSSSAAQLLVPRCRRAGPCQVPK